MLDEALEAHQLPGVVLGVFAEDQEPLLVARGSADGSVDAPLSPDASFRAGSVTKMFIATVVLQLVSEGRLDLDDPLGSHLPEPAGYGEITIRQLLNHTSGIFDYTDDESVKKAIDADPLRKWSTEEILEVISERPGSFAAGEGWAYSNTNYIILGMLIEKITRGSLDDELAARICVPLHLTDTFLPSGPDLPDNAAHGFADKDGDGIFEDVTLLDPSIAGPAGALVTTAADVACFLEALMDGELINAALLDEMTAWIDYGKNIDPPEAYGLGLARMGDLIGHGGEIVGFESSVYYVPGQDTVLVVWFNRSGSGRFADTLLKEAARVRFPAGG